ncbi:acyl-CoA N-acyltransferase [Punctularia strigosozonata HHB-11173 SS5]|uniref:acyl-CoA N-acyltransferase n=1 Tax=Punctularia strigosozonata (strain HHB-11173) TaxID=741275 RepID=UPI0004416E9D|nr:acyl-CoA N-acyltransferase [Punctularia strigosozonata HHB-11173 SS5]EIN13298.1 acyl-CoA N-acyltransferase [Punctularia strigosozonata HHB-11173 SS5]
MPVLRPFAQPIQDNTVYTVTTLSGEQQAHVLDRRGVQDAEEVYVHYLGTDKRLDEWVPANVVSISANQPELDPSTSPAALGRKRRRARSSSVGVSEAPDTREGSLEPDDEAEMNGNGSIVDGASDAGALGVDDGTAMMTEEEFDLQHHKRMFAQRNFETVTFYEWQIRTWYFSPYPILDEADDPTALPSSSNGHFPASAAHTRASSHPLSPTGVTPSAPLGSHGVSSLQGPGQRGQGIPRSSIRAHGRTSDLWTGGLKRAHTAPEKSTLWVCHRCFKYMTDGLSWEMHIKRCTMNNPPGRKVYQRGAHIIWEVDGLKEKLYCQNLSLFGKLFIDIKTIFFDMDNFLFYVLTDADSQRDHALGFFSKEKVSYDDYNLACIVIFPPYQRKRYGMLLIEFSYELSKRAGVIGTPERPLSDLGLRTYLNYWVSTILRHLQKLLSVVPPDMTVRSGPQMPDLSKLRAKSEDLMTQKPKKKKTKGWDGEIDLSELYANQPPPDDPNTSLTSRRTLVTRGNPDGSATTHVVVHCTLEDLSRATYIRVEDAAFALNECGLLLRKKHVEGNTRNGEEAVDGEPAEQMIVVVSREMIDEVARQWGLKRMCMETPHILL